MQIYIFETNIRCVCLRKKFRAKTQGTQRKSMNENEISKILMGIFIDVHSELGPGLLESVYEEVICYELKKKEIQFERQKTHCF